MTIFYVAFGGALGAVLRYAVSATLSTPFGTFAVNALGCFAMGLAMVYLIEAAQTPHGAAPFLMTGLLGGFTTYSAFALDTLRLFEAGQLAAAAAYAVGTFVLALVSVFAGVLLGRVLLG